MSLRNPERGLFSVKGLISSLGLVASFIFVGVLYGGLIYPGAERSALASNYGVEADAGGMNLYLILAGIEQQVCLSLFLWGVMIVAYKFVLLRAEAKVVDGWTEGTDSPVTTAGRSVIDRDEAGAMADKVDALAQSAEMRDKVLPYVTARGLERYHVTGSVPEATDTMMGRIEVAAEQQESELSMLRYLVWAIPSIGFIGTVRGIGLALHRADEALQGDISGVTAALGTAFNSTLIALIIAIFLMLLIHLLQSGQEGLILRLRTYCREELLDRLYDRERRTKDEERNHENEARRTEDERPRAEDEASTSNPPPPAAPPKPDA